MNFEQEQIAYEKGVEFNRLVAEKLEAIDIDDLPEDRFIGAIVHAINEASAAINPGSLELVYELDEGAA